MIRWYDHRERLEGSATACSLRQAGNWPPLGSYGVTALLIFREGRKANILTCLTWVTHLRRPHNFLALQQRPNCPETGFCLAAVSI